jgi:hypothetical protein
MQFLKKNYEKVLLGLVLVGLVAVAVFLLLVVANEKQKMADITNGLIFSKPRELPPPNLGAAEAALKRTGTQVMYLFADNTHRLLNPVRWQKRGDERPFKNPSGSEIEKVEITKQNKLFLNISFNPEGTSYSDLGAKYTIAVEPQAALKQQTRGKKPYLVAVGEKKEYGDKKDTFTLLNVQGPTNSPTGVVLDLSDSDKPITVAADKPFQRVDGYTVDMKYAPENKTFLNRRFGDPVLGKITVAGEDYNIVAPITEHEVTLSDKKGKKWTIKYNASP